MQPRNDQILATDTYKAQILEAMRNEKDQMLTVLQSLHTLFTNDVFPSTSYLAFPLEDWQREIVNNQPGGGQKYLHKEDSNQNGYLHYATLSGNCTLFSFAFLAWDKQALWQEFYYHDLYQALFFSKSIALMNHIWDHHKHFLVSHNDHFKNFQQNAVYSMSMLGWDEGLLWLEAKYPNIWELPMALGDGGHWAIHTLAKYGRLNLLKQFFIQPQKRELLRMPMQNGMNIAHIFVYEGFLEGVEWIIQVFPELLKAEYAYGKAIHLAAESGNPFMLDYIAKETKKLLSTGIFLEDILSKEPDDDTGLNYIDFAWLSENPEQLNMALTHSKDKNTLHLNLIWNKNAQMPAGDDLSNLIPKALETNFSLLTLQVKNNPYDWSNAYFKINQQLYRNHLIHFFNCLFEFYLYFKAELIADIFTFMFNYMAVNGVENYIHDDDATSMHNISPYNDFSACFFNLAKQARAEEKSKFCQNRAFK